MSEPEDQLVEYDNNDNDLDSVSGFIESFHEGHHLDYQDILDDDDNDTTEVSEAMVIALMDSNNNNNNNNNNNISMTSTHSDDIKQVTCGTHHDS